MSKMTKRPITGVEEIIDELAEILSLLSEIISYNYSEMSADVMESIEAAEFQRKEMLKLVDLFGKGIKLILVSSKDLESFIGSKKVIYDPAFETEYCKFVILPESGTCVLSVRGY